MAEKRYLGDSVYAAFDGYHVVLTTENGMGASNTIYLDGAVLTALDHFVGELRQAPAARWCSECETNHTATDDCQRVRSTSAGRGASDAR